MRKKHSGHQEHFEECTSLVDSYAAIDFDSTAMIRFNDEILSSIEAVLPLTDTTTFLDIGCGRGYFLKYLSQAGYKHIQGLEPSRSLASEAFIEQCMSGSFEQNSLPDDSFDIVLTCHTLHHLPDPYPIYAIEEMLRITKKYIVIVEINNTNIPMYLRSLLLFKQEVHAFRYNLRRVKNLLAEVQCRLLYSQNMKASYLSGDSLYYRFLSKLGNAPYNISIAEVKNRS